MNRFERTRFKLRPLPRWKLVLIASIAVAIVIALAIVTASLVLILVPVILLAALLHRLFAPRQPRRDNAAARDTRIIETDYEVIDVDGRRDR